MIEDGNLPMRCSKLKMIVVFSYPLFLIPLSRTTETTKPPFFSILKQLRSAAINFSWCAPLATLIALLLSVASPAKASALLPGPSFNCASPSEIEAVICGDPELSATDRRMADFYAVAMAGALGTGSNQLITQRKWLRERDKSCAQGAWREFYKNLRACVAAEYEERIEQLAIATLIANPGESLAELGRIRPKAVPLYRAVYDYASIDDPERRTEIVEADLAPIYSAIDANTLGHLQLAPYYEAATAHAAASSDVNFAAFFAIYAVLGYGDHNNRLSWPCAVLVKRPGLVAGLGSYFGGAIDGAIPNSDCYATLPPLSEVTMLSNEANGTEPFCQGTIRFSTGRDYIKLQDAVRLHRTEVWENRVHMSRGDSNVLSNQPIRAWRITHKARIDRATAVLKDYYVKYFGVDQNIANRDALSAIDALIEEPFQSCE